MRQWLPIACLLLIVIAGAGFFLARVGVPNVVGSGQAHAEKTAVSTLRTLHWAQGLFRQGTFLDVDGNGVGEFGQMGQLAARDPVSSGEPLANTLLPAAGTRVTGEIFEMGGYCFRFDLPDDLHGRERRFVGFAWPRQLEAGRKLFCIDQDEQIYESTNPEGYAGCFDGGPPAGICPDGDPVAAGWKRWKNKTNKLSVGAVD